MLNVIKLFFQVFIILCGLDLIIVYLLYRRAKRVDMRNRNETIRQRWIDGYSKDKIANEFKLSVSTINRIIGKKVRWYRKDKDSKRLEGDK